MSRHCWERIKPSRRAVAPRGHRSISTTSRWRLPLSSASGQRRVGKPYGTTDIRQELLDTREPGPRTATITRRTSPTSSTTLLTRQSRPTPKLLATGNGVVVPAGGPPVLRMALSIHGRMVSRYLSPLPVCQPLFDESSVAPVNGLLIYDRQCEHPAAQGQDPQVNYQHALLKDGGVLSTHDQLIIFAGSPYIVFVDERPDRPKGTSGPLAACGPANLPRTRWAAHHRTLTYDSGHRLRALAPRVANPCQRLPARETLSGLVGSRPSPNGQPLTSVATREKRKHPLVCGYFIPVRNSCLDILSRVSRRRSPITIRRPAPRPPHPVRYHHPVPLVANKTGFSGGPDLVFRSAAPGAREGVLCRLALNSLVLKFENDDGVAVPPCAHPPDSRNFEGRQDPGNARFGRICRSAAFVM